jgi:hypothetical protein
MAKDKEVPAPVEENLPMAASFEEDADKGFENTDPDSYAIPFLRILQALSPQVDSDSDAYINGASQGDFFETVSSDVFNGKAGIKVIPCYYKRAYIEWSPRDADGGFVAEHTVAEARTMATTKDEKNKDVLENGNHLVDTRMHYCLFMHPLTGRPVPVILSLSSTQIKKSKQWMTIMSNIKLEGRNGLFTPPSYSHVYTLSTVSEENNKGKWKGLKVELADPIDNADLYAAAKSFHEQVKVGLAEPAYDTANVGSDEEAPF